MSRLKFLPALISALAALILIACQPSAVPALTSAVASPSIAITPTLAATQAGPISPTLTPGPARASLRLWTSPEAAPGEQTPGGEILARQLAAFEQANPGVTVEVRVKKTSGVGGLLDFLRTASTAAPAALPDVIGLSRDDLVKAAAENLIAPMDALVPADSLADYYPMALDAARVNGHFYGLPFAADATALAYRTDAFAAPPLAWADVVSATGGLLIPAGDPAGLVTLQQYRALGGPLSDTDGKPMIDPAVLAQVLTFYQSASIGGVLPANAADYNDASATWAAYRENRAALAAAPAGLYLRERERAGTRTGVTLLLTRDGNPLALGTAWSYALVTTDASRQSLALALIQSLTAPANVGEWTLAAGVLPPRSSALDAWPDPRLRAFAAQTLSAAELQPDADVLALIGPPLKQAAIDVIAGRATPQAAAERAATTVAGK